MSSYIDNQEILMEICRKKCRILYSGENESQSLRYFMLSFSMPSLCGTLKLSLSRFTEKEAQIPVALFDCDGKMRIFRAPEGAKGLYTDSYMISGKNASSGAVPGLIKEGEWKLVLYKRRFFEDIEVEIVIEALEDDFSGDMASLLTFQDKIVNQSNGWYRGELHVHSSESTGRRSVEDVLAAADEEKLDFLAITDHFTSSHWRLIEELSKAHKVLCLKSMEVSGDKGHANVHGLKDWINPLVDDNECLSAFLGLKERPSMSAIADCVHSMGGLFGINHPLSGMVGWQYADFPIEKADMIDIWASPDNATSLCYPTLYDSYLVQGYRLVAVGSSDSHDPRQEKGPWRFGQLYTYVYADCLSSKGIIEGIKRGRVYVACGKSRMDMILSYNGEHYHMGDAVPYYGGDVELSVEIGENPSGNLFIMISGQLNSVHYIDSSSDMRTYIFHIPEHDIHMLKSLSAFIRIEFFEDVVKAKFWGMAHRDAESMRLLSNPIWLNKEIK